MLAKTQELRNAKYIWNSPGYPWSDTAFWRSFWYYVKYQMTTRILKNTWKFYETSQCYTTLRYTNADMKICRYLFHIKIICRGFHTVAPFIFEICLLKMFKIVVEKIYKSNVICWKEAYVLRKMQNWRLNNSKILYFYL